MELIPAIDIRGGRCVRLYQGDYDRETVFADDPAEVAARFHDAGATRLHIVDLDGAREGRPVNTEAIERILKSVGMLVDVGGGIRRLEDAGKYFDLGADAIVLGTAAVKDSHFLAQALDSFKERVIVGIDAKSGLVAVEGWREVSRLSALELAQEMVKLGAESLIYTDIMRDGTLDEPNFAAIKALVESVPAKVIAAGGVSRLEHVLRLAEIGAAGAIAGRAVYTGDIDLKQALDELAKRV
jgi:phosphoribosylformimino-5-aminoimidazole carboxamide ribotide isomerase